MIALRDVAKALAEHTASRHGMGLHSGWGCTRNLSGRPSGECRFCHEEGSTAPRSGVECARFLKQSGEMAEAGEVGIGRMAEPLEIVAAALPLLGKDDRAKLLAGKRMIVTSGPTHEPIDPVRYIANRSSGKQGHALARAAAALGESTRLKQRIARECTMSRKGQPAEAVDLLVVATPVRIGDQDLTVCVLRDISAEKRRSVLERVFFHDVINTAGGIRGIAALVAQGELQDPAQEAEYRRWLLELSERLMDEIVHQRKLLAAEKGEFVPESGIVDLSALLRDVHALYVNHEVATGINLVIGDSPAGLIMSDGAILRRILGNLVKNALEATPAGGTVSISALREGGTVTFFVRNPGVMPEGVQLQLFTRSFSTKEGSGRGIGTYSVKLFGERYLKGSVSFVSNEEEGTVFRLALPVVADRP